MTRWRASPPGTALSAAGDHSQLLEVAQLKLGASPRTQAPPAEVIHFLDDGGSEHSAFQRDSPSGPPVANGSSGGGGSPPVAPSDSSAAAHLLKQKSMAAARMDSGVSELWTVDFKELGLQKQIGEGSFGKVGAVGRACAIRRQEGQAGRPC